MSNIFEHEYSEIERRKALIDSVASELKKEFKEMETLSNFIDYLANFEKMIAGFSGNKENFEEEYLEIEMSSLSAQFHIDRQILYLMYERFDEELDFKNIEWVKDEILKKYPEHEDYQKFVGYLEKVFKDINSVLEKRKEEENFDRQSFKEECIKRKIEELSADGDPKEEQLWEIVKEFEEKIGK